MAFALIVKLRKLFSPVGLLVFYVTCDDHISVIYVTAQMCRRTEEEVKLYLRSGSKRHRHFAGFFNVPFLHRHGTTLLYGDSDTTLVAFTTRWGSGGRILDLNPRCPQGGILPGKILTARRIQMYYLPACDNWAVSCLGFQYICCVQREEA